VASGIGNNDLTLPDFCQRPVLFFHKNFLKVDVFKKMHQDKGPLGKHASVGHGYFMFPKLEGEIAPRMTFRGRELLTWSLNNYLGLANHPEVRQVDTEATAKYGLPHGRPHDVGQLEPDRGV
jgi:hypothetical protein